MIILFGCFTIVPFDAGAQSVVVKTWAELVSAVNSRSAVVLGADIAGGESDAFLQIAEGSEIVIDLNGCTLSRGAIGKDDPGYVFKIASNASLTVTDASGNDSGQITGGSSKHGGAFYNQGTLTIEGGSICNNYASDGGGAVCNKGTFNMSGGVICSNVSADGGAVYNDVGGVMTLSGTAKLTGNESNSAGGGAVTNYGRCTILDAAALSQNKAFTRGGAVWTGGNSTLALYGGVITQNTAGLAGSGVYYADGTLNMQGAPQVRLNDADDLFLCNGKKITVTGRLVPSFATPGEYPNVGIITLGYGRYNPDFTNPYNFFFSCDYHELETRDGKLYKDVEKFFGGFVKISSTKGVVDNYTNAAALLLILGITAIVDYSRDNDVVGAGIGGGSGASSGSITINGGTVNATGGYSGAAIGSGKRGSLDSITINGGAVTATNVLNTNGIGAGANGASTTVTLNWTEDTKDTMSVISYRGYSGTVKLDRPFEDKSSGTVFYRTANADKSKLSGKTLTPFTKLFAGHSLTLNGDIGVNFFLNLTAEQAAKTTVSFRWFNKTHNDVPVEAVEGRPGIYRTSCPVAVAEMTYEITATVTIDNAIQEETDRYKVVSYADVILNDQDFITAYVREHGAQGYERLSTLVKTMLDYGAKAQLRFDRDKNNPANGGEDFFTDPVTIENNADDMTAELEACGLSYVGSSVIYLSQTTLRHYYKITEPDKFTEEVRNGITFDGKAAAYGERDGMIYFDKKDIAAPQLDTEYVIRINGNDYHYAVLDYIARAYNDESASPIEKELAAAVCRYHAAADAYFGN